MYSAIQEEVNELKSEDIARIQDLYGRATGAFYTIPFYRDKYL